MSSNDAPVVRVRVGAQEPSVAPDDGLTSVRFDELISVRFDDSLPLETVAVEADSPHQLALAIAAHWQPVRADFRQQLINTRVAERLLKIRPRALIIEQITGATLDLVRLGPILGIPSLVYPAAAAQFEDDDARRWYDAALADAHAQLRSPGEEAPALAALQAPAQRRFDYALYEFVQRDHALLDRQLAPVLPHFVECRRVLDLACGPGIFVHALRRRGVAASGVERSAMAARYGRSIGLDIAEDDALAFLGRQIGEYDGLLCSHFVEHLPIDVLQHLMALIAQALRPGGIAVFVFPDPESIRSQLLGFWRDPEHVRFYHPDLIELLARAAGLEADYHSHRAQAHQVVSFPVQPPAAPAAAIPPARRAWHRFWPGRKIIDEQARQIAELQARVAGLQQAVDKLWQVNLTWAWEDNAIVRVRKPA